MRAGSEWGIGSGVAVAAAALLLAGALGKSAQLPLQVWLPDAMAGPTPVSALIHAATMVTAGVYMVARLNFIYALSPSAMGWVALIGALTALFAASIGFFQYDIKKVLAYSTVSQLGFMFIGVGVGAWWAGVYHLLTHACFKATLFRGSGSVILGCHHEQDMRKMGGLASKLPITWAMMLIGTLALTGVGIPGLAGFAGFYSKDAIIEASFAAHTPNNYAFWLLVIAAFMTAFYSWRLMFMTFHQPTRADHHTFDHAHESPWVMLVPLLALATGAVVAGFAFQKFFIGHDYAEFWRASLFESAHNHVRHAMHEVPEWVGWAPFVAMLAGFALSWLYYMAAPWLPGVTATAFKPVYLFFLNKWYFDELYDWLFVRPAFWLGRLLWKRGDGTIIDGLGPDNVAARVLWTTGRVVKLQTGYVYHYAFAMLIGVAIIITAFMFNDIRALFSGVGR
jgi:NADH-quinone oxidoreductase subunit L